MEITATLLIGTGKKPAQTSSLSITNIYPATYSQDSLRIVKINGKSVSQIATAIRLMFEEIQYLSGNSGSLRLNWNIVD